MKFLKIILMIGLLFFSARAVAKSQSSLQTYSRTQIVFGNIPLKIEITTTLTQKRAFREMEKMFVFAREFNQTLSTYLKDSELSRLNRLPKPARGIKLSPLLCEALTQAQIYTTLTENHFDVTYRMQKPNAEALQINERCHANLLDKNLIVDPTGLAKGLAVDHILTHFKKIKKIQSAFVAISGDMGVFDRLDSPKLIDLHNPAHQSGRKVTVALNNEAISTSGLYERGNHIRNTGKEMMRPHLQTTVIAPNGVTSDALSTAFLFMSESGIKKILAQLDHVRVIIYRADGHIRKL